MGSSDAIKIAVELIIAVALITLTFFGVRQSIHGVNGAAQSAFKLGRDATQSEVKSINNQTVDGITAITFLDKFSNSVPIMLVTSELYNVNSEKSSYNAKAMHVPTAPEYVSHDSAYRIDVYLDSREDVIGIRAVQSTLLGKPDLPVMDTADTAYKDAAEYLKLQQQLIEFQNQLREADNKSRETT